MLKGLLANLVVVTEDEEEKKKKKDGEDQELRCNIERYTISTCMCIRDCAYCCTTMSWSCAVEARW